MDAHTQRLAGRILSVLRDEPFEQAVPVLGSVLAFYVSKADDPEWAIEQLSEILRSVVPRGPELQR